MKANNSPPSTTLEEVLRRLSQELASPHSLGLSGPQLYQVARSITTLNVAHFTNAQDPRTLEEDPQDYCEKLSKLLQLCQSIIEFLLLDAKRAELERCPATVPDDNLAQENAKLRKLLSLQQKALLYRRVATGGHESLTTAADDNDNDEDEDNTTTTTTTSATTSATWNGSSSGSGSTLNQTLQCLYCPKVFRSSVPFVKHLTLRHLSPEDGWSSRGQTSLLESVEKSSQVYGTILAGQEAVQQLRSELAQLKSQLTLTEQQLSEERKARKCFEDHLKDDLGGRVEALQRELEAKLKHKANEDSHECDGPKMSKELSLLEQRLRRLVLEGHGRNEEDEESVDDDQENGYRGSRSSKLSTEGYFEDGESKRSQTSSKASAKEYLEDAKSINGNAKSLPKSVKEYLEDTKRPRTSSKESGGEHFEDGKSLKRPQTSRKESAKSTLNNFDKNEDSSLKLDSSSTKVVEILNLEEEPKVRKAKKTVVNGDQAVHVQMDKIADSGEDSNRTESNSEPSNKTELKQSLRLQLISQLNSRVEGKNQQEAKMQSEEPIKLMSPETGSREATKAEIAENVESRLRSYMEQPEVAGGDKEEVFKVASERLQRDKELLIHQARYDYDFVQIESAIRETIDSKLRARINSEPEVHQEPEVVNSEPAKYVEETEELEEVEEIAPEVRQLKSILKQQTGSGNETKTRKSRGNSGRITFNSEVTEFEISPRESETEEWDGGGEEEDGEMQYPSLEDLMLVHDQLEDEEEEEEAERRLQSRMANDGDFSGEKVFLGQYQSSSSSPSTTSDEDEDEDSNNNNNNAVVPLKNFDNDDDDDEYGLGKEIKVEVELHNQPPRPATRQSVQEPESNSLLFEPITAGGNRTQPEAKSTRVQQLTELIERKLQARQAAEASTSSSSQQPSASNKLPAGSVDTLTLTKPSTSSSNSKSGKSQLDYDIYDF